MRCLSEDSGVHSRMFLHSISSFDQLVGGRQIFLILDRNEMARRNEWTLLRGAAAFDSDGGRKASNECDVERVFEVVVLGKSSRIRAWGNGSPFDRWWVGRDLEDIIWTGESGPRQSILRCFDQRRRGDRAGVEASQREEKECVSQDLAKECEGEKTSVEVSGGWNDEALSRRRLSSPVKPSLLS